MLHQFRLACSGVFLLLSSTAFAAPTPVQVSLGMKGDNAFLVRYDFPTPISQFQFKQPQLETRKSDWQLNNPDLILDDSGLRSKSQQAFSQVTIEIPILRTSKLRQYDTTTPLGSHGAAILSEHLALAPESWSTSFTFSTDGVVRGRNVPAGTAWRDDLTTDPIQGAYLYLGPLRAERIQSASFLFDPATPPWIRQEVIDTVGRLAKAYGSKFGIAKERINPALILSMQASNGPSENYRGDTLPGQALRLALYGQEWSIRTEDRQRKLRRFLAHELAHLFNSELSRPVHYEQAWIHEGMAEYAALAILSELQLVSPQYALDTVNASINACQQGIGGRALSDIRHASPEQRLFYDCGIALFYTYDKLARHGSGSKKQDFFSAMRAAFRNQQYSAESLLALIEGQRSSPAFRFVETLMTQGRLDPAHSLASVLPALGLRLQPAPPSYDNGVYLKTLADFVIRRDCKSGAGYWTMSDGLKVDGQFACTAFAESPVITQVENQLLLGNAQRGLDQVRQICREPEASFSVQANDGRNFRLNCGGSPQAVPESLYLDQL